MLLLIHSFFRYICTRFHYLLSLDNDVLETSKRRAMFYNILSQNFIVECLTKSLLIRIFQNKKKKKKGKGSFYLTSVVPSVPTRLLSMEADGNRVISRTVVILCVCVCMCVCVCVCVCVCFFFFLLIPTKAKISVSVVFCMVLVF